MVTIKDRIQEVKRMSKSIGLKLNAKAIQTYATDVSMYNTLWKLYETSKSYSH